MEFVIENHIREFGKTRSRGQYSDATIKNYISSIRSLHRMVNGKEAMFDDLDWARDHENVFKVVAQKENVQTRRNLVNGLIVSLQTLGFKHDTIKPYEDLRDQYNSQYVQAGHLTPKQTTILTAVKKEHILKFLSDESLDTGLSTDLTRFSCWCILSLHTAYPFRNELGTMRFVRRVLYDKMSDEQKKINNWVILDKGFGAMTFALTNYKTQKTYGIKEIAVEAKYTRYLLKMAQLRDIKLTDIHNVPVFVTKDGSPFNKNKVSKYLSEYTMKGLGHPISTTLLAKMFGTCCADPLNPTPAELNQMSKEADIRGHSLATKIQVYGAV